MATRRRVASCDNEEATPMIPLYIFYAALWLAFWDSVLIGPATEWARCSPSKGLYGRSDRLTAERFQVRMSCEGGAFAESDGLMSYGRDEADVIRQIGRAR
jgi:hypothetical protein